MEHFSHLVQGLINKQFNSPMIYSKSNFEKGDYVKALIHSLIKVNDEKLSKPLDIMITQHNQTIYCASFDFNICQNYLNYRNFLSNEFMSIKDLHTVLKESNLKFSPQDMLEKIVCYPGSLTDLSNQTYTMKFNSLRLENIEYYMERHYSRMKEKLPDFKLNFICHSLEHQYIADYYLAQNRFDELEKIIPNKHVEHKHKKKL